MLTFPNLLIISEDTNRHLLWETGQPKRIKDNDTQNKQKYKPALKTGKLAQQVTTFSAMSDDLSWILWSPQVVL